MGRLSQYLRSSLGIDRLDTKLEILAETQKRSEIERAKRLDIMLKSLDQSQGIQNKRLEKQISWTIDAAQLLTRLNEQVSFVRNEAENQFTWTKEIAKSVEKLPEIAARLAAQDNRLEKQLAWTKDTAHILERFQDQLSKLGAGSWTQPASGPRVDGVGSASQELAASVPVAHDERFRIEMTVSCGDCDALPKVPDAGAVTFEAGESVQIMHNGLRVVAGGYHGALMTEIISRLRGHHEPQEELIFDTLLRCLPEQATMIEVGGFWSYYSLWFLRQGSGRRSIVIEPDPNYMEIGRRNAVLNQATIDFVSGFVGREDHSERAFKTESAGVVQLPMINLATFMGARGIDLLDVLHCDAQGAEFDVLRSCEELFRRGQIRFLFLSTHAAAVTGDPLTHQLCLDAVRTMGGQILAEHDVHESFSGDGLILAHFGSEPIQWVKPEMSYNRYSTSLFRNPVYDLRLARAEIDRLREKLADQV